MTTERVAELYVEQEMSFREIGTLMGVAPRTVRRRLEAAGVQIRSSEESRTLRARRWLDPLQVAILYHGQQLTLTQVAELLGTSHASVRKVMIESGQPPRTRAQRRAPLDVEEMRRMYEEEGLGLLGIAARVGMDHTTVGKRLKEAGVPMRAAWGRARR